MARTRREVQDYQNQWRKDRYASDPEYRERRIGYNKAMRAADGDRLKKRRNQYLKRVHGISSAEFDVMSEKQGGLCRVCGKSSDRQVVDHCHETGRLRGLLCTKCNVGLGHFEDSPSLLRLAATYLEDSRRGD